MTTKWQDAGIWITHNYRVRMTLQIGPVCQSFSTHASLFAVLGSRLRVHFPMILPWISSWQTGIQKPQGMRHPNYAHSSLALLLDDLIVERLHSRPMHL